MKHRPLANSRTRDLNPLSTIRLAHFERAATVLAVILLVVSACAVEQAERIRIGETDYGVTAGNFRGQWYDYYERGASYIEGALAAKDEGDEAGMRKAAKLDMADLEKAIKMRGEDQRRPRT